MYLVAELARTKANPSHTSSILILPLLALLLPFPSPPLCVVRKSFVTGVKRPTLFKWGGFSLGALGALQVAFWRMRRMYSRVDPDGSLQAELRVLFERSKQQQ